MREVLDLNALQPDDLALLDEIATSIGETYNSFIDELGNSKLNDVNWWVSELSSRNPFTNELFVCCANLELIRKLIGQGRKIDRIITGSIVFRNVLRSNFRKSKLQILVDSHEKSYKIFFLPGKIFLEYISSVYHLFRQYFCAKMTRSGDPINGEIILVDTFFLENSIDDDRYADRYYSNFGDCLSDSEKENIFFLPTFDGIKKYYSVFRKIRASRKFLLKEDFLKLIDYFYAISFPFRTFFWRPTNFFFLDYDLKSLLCYIHFRNIANRSSMTGLLNFRFAYRLQKAKKKFTIRLILEWFENQLVDRGAVFGYKKYLPETQVVGYSVPYVSKFFHCILGYTKSETDAGVIPLTIALTGKALLKNFAVKNNQIRFTLAPAFRFTWASRVRNFFPDPEFFTILVVLPIMVPAAVELLRSIEGVIAGSRKLRIFVKPHPTVNASIIIALYGKKIPDHFVFVSGDFTELAEKADLLFGVNSSSLIEAVCKGIPVIVIGNRSGLTYNNIPESFPKELWSLCYSKEEIEKTLNFYSDKSPDELKEYGTIGMAMTAEYFEPVTREKTLEFLQLDSS